MSGSGRGGDPSRTGTPVEADQGTWKRVALGALVLGLGAFVGLLALFQTVGGVIGAVLLGLAVLVVASSVEIVQAYERRALTVLGDYRGLVGPGINFVPPFVSDTTVFDMRTQTLDVPSQEAITRDNSPVVANAVIYMRVMNPERAFLEVEDYERAVSNLAQTTLRAVLGDMELDDTLSKRRQINERIREELAGPTDEWGVRVESVEVQEITPSTDVLNAMEQQTAAERRRRAMILEAQGERRSAIEKAQGDKQSNIIEAQGEKQAQILEAQGDAISTVLRAKSAEAMGERAIIDKGMETLESIGQAESTTYVLPQEVSSLLGRYGKHLTGSNVAGDGQTLESLEFDSETQEMLGLDDISELAEGIQMNGEESEIEAIAQADDNQAESEVLEQADDNQAESEVIQQADDNQAESEVIQQADDNQAESETIREADAGRATDSVESATEEARSAIEDAVPDVEVETDPEEGPGGSGPSPGPDAADPDAQDEETLGDMWERPDETGETDAETETDAEKN
jgi:regulator of protease activity HflC (stomatin/prohibitin superfamily)